MSLCTKNHRIPFSLFSSYTAEVFPTSEATPAVLPTSLRTHIRQGGIFFLYTRIPWFSKFSVHQFVFTKDLYFLLTKRNSEKNFAFVKKGEKWKQHLAFVLQGVSQRQHMLWAARVAPSSSFCSDYIQHLASGCHISDCVCEHLCFSSIYFVHLLVRGVLRQSLLHFRHFSFKKVS